MGGCATGANLRGAAGATRVVLAALLAALCLLAASAPASAMAVLEAPECVCQSPDLHGLELIHGEGQVAQCKQGYYCDCTKGKRERCINVWGLGYKFDEGRQECAFKFDCDQFFKSEAATTVAPPTAGPTSPMPSSTSPPTSAPPECVCQSPDLHGLELIRGEGQVTQCKQGYYCDCAKGKRERCINVWGLGYKFDEGRQECAFKFDCDEFFAPQPTPDPRPSPSPSPSPGPAPECECDPGHGDAIAMLMRGEDEVSLCERGWYCQCKAGTRAHCSNIWGLGWRFNEDRAYCAWNFDCRAFFERERNGTTVAPPTGTTPTETAPTVTAPTATAPTGTAPTGTATTGTATTGTLPTETTPVSIRPTQTEPPSTTQTRPATTQTQPPTSQTQPTTAPTSQTTQRPSPTRKPSSSMGAAARATLSLVIVSVVLAQLAQLALI